MNAIREKKLTERDLKINDFVSNYNEEFQNIDKNIREKIAQSKASEIKEDICERKLYSSKTVVLVYCFASIEASTKTNCLTEIMFEEAINRAEYNDKYFEEQGKPIGPLHGIPFSVKDTFDIKGFGIFKKNILWHLFMFRFNCWID